MKEILGKPTKELVKVKLEAAGLVADVVTTTTFNDETDVKETTTFVQKRLCHVDLTEAFNGLTTHFAAMTGRKPEQVEVTGLVLKDYLSEEPRVMILGKSKLPFDNASISMNTHLISVNTTTYSNRKLLDDAVKACIREVMEYLFAGKIAEPEVWQLKLDFNGAGRGNDVPEPAAVG